nr:MAG TPA: hypothetical protein [Caudoviricetes sp.]
MYVGKFKGYVADDGIEYRTDAREVGADDPVFVEVGTSRQQEDGKVFSYLHFGNEEPGYLKVETHECADVVAISFKTDIDTTSLIKALRYAAQCLENQLEEDDETWEGI